MSCFGFLLKLIWCMYDQSSLRPIDGKCRSATALLDYNLFANHAKYLKLMYETHPLSFFARNQRLKHSLCRIAKNSRHKFRNPQFGCSIGKQFSHFYSMRYGAPRQQSHFHRLFASTRLSCIR